MSAFEFQTVLNSPDDTAKFAVALATCLQQGDTVLLSGPIGAGKTHVARHLIQSLLLSPEDIPSPTFTLIQVYETRLGTVQHADLYRLSGSDGVVELGLLESFGTDICIVEWPDRLGEDAPRDALHVTLDTQDDPDIRFVSMQCLDENFSARLRDYFHD